MYNEVEVKAILIAVHNIENVGLNSKKVLLNSIEWLICQYEITQDESFLIKAVWHIYAYLYTIVEKCWSRRIIKHYGRKRLSYVLQRMRLSFKM